jgi:hypothetical protein
LALTAEHLLRGVGLHDVHRATTRSPSRSSMPRTPRESRPVGRMSSTEKRMLMPPRVPMSTSWPSVTTRAASRESPSSMATPMMPVWRMFS